MGNTDSFQKLNFENIKDIIKGPRSYLLINTLPTNEQSCLIYTTTIASDEEDIINKHCKNNIKDIKIIIYGKNCNDSTLNQKYKQLHSLGFINIYIYLGGMFEWLLLQDIYGSSEFLTTTRQLDILKYK